ncbi:hypothetical protein GCM10027259_09540 [Micromonospora palomenae]
MSGAAAGAVASAFLAHGLGRTDFGWFASTLAIVSLVNLAADLGLTQTVTRQIVINPGGERRIIEAALLVRLSLAVFMLIFATWWAVHADGAPKLSMALLLAAVPISALSVYQSVLLARLRPDAIALGNIVQSLVWTGGCAVALFLNASAVAFAAIFAGATLLQMALVALFARRHLADADADADADALPRVRIRTATSLLAASWLVGVGSLAWAAFNRGPLLIVVSLAGPDAAAALGAAARFVDAAYLLPTILASMLLPIATSRFRVGEELGSIIRASIGWITIAGTLVVQFTAVLGEGIAAWLLGPGFSDLGLILTICLAATIPFGWDCVWGTALIAAGRGSTMAWTGLVAVVISLGGSALFVREYGAIAAAVSILVAQATRALLLAVAQDGLAAVRFPYSGVIGLMVLTLVICWLGLDAVGPRETVERVAIALTGALGTLGMAKVAGLLPAGGVGRYLGKGTRIPS